jgi:NAD(P)H dehydrogenase (quinone)
VPLSRADQGQSGVDVAPGGSPCQMTTIADNGSRQPFAQELESAKFPGRRMAEITVKLHGRESSP